MWFFIACGFISDLEILFKIIIATTFFEFEKENVVSCDILFNSQILQILVVNSRTPPL